MSARAAAAALVLVLVSLVALPRAVGGDWSGVDAVLTAAIAAKTFPGCAASVTAPNGTVVYAKAFGSLTYGEPAPVPGGNPAVTFDGTFFDMASLTKIVAVTSSAAWLYERGLLALDTAVSDASLRGPAFASHGKADMTVLNLLLHNSGFPADPSPGYWEAPFACPATVANATRPALDFNCSERILDSVLGQTLLHPPGQAYLYSDLNFITGLYVVASVVVANGLVAPAAYLPACSAAAPLPRGLELQCAFEAFFRTFVARRMNLPTAHYLLTEAQRAAAMPTWNDTEYRHEVLQGVVSDENAYAVGGVSGHAGVWCTGADAAAFMSTWRLRAAGSGGLLNATTVAKWTTAYDPAFSPRALGWSTNADAYQGCGRMSPTTAYHTGYTGTQLCADLAINVSTTLLTARVYPDKLAHNAEIQRARPPRDARSRETRETLPPLLPRSRARG